MTHSNTDYSRIPGPGDLAIAYLDRQERDEESRLIEMDDADFIINRICPSCRGIDRRMLTCTTCDGDGVIVPCDTCGEPTKTSEAITADGVTLCRACETAFVVKFALEVLP